MKAQKKKIEIEFKTRLKLDHLTFGWMCPLCEKIYSPYIIECPVSHKVSEDKMSLLKLDNPNPIP